MKPIEGNMVIGPETAATWRSAFHYSGQRQFRSWHAANLATEMKEGRFRPKTQIAFAEFEGKIYNTNGQHTLAAIEFSQTQQMVSVVINQCESLAAVADDFARHDTHLTRRFSDSLVAHDVHTRLGVTPSSLQLITAGAIYYSQIRGDIGARSQMLTHDSKMKIVDAYGELARDALALLAGALNISYLTRKTTLASLMLTFDAQPELAMEFWRAMVLDDGLRIGDPRKTLLAWLREHISTGGAYGNTRVAKKATADHEFVKGIAAGWNAWIKGKELKIIRTEFNAHLATFERVGQVKVRTEVRTKA